MLQKSITLVIPTFNEAQGIAHHLGIVLQQLDALANYRWRVLLVDDGSQDHTAETISALCAQHDSLELLCLTRNFGKEAALLAGLQEAVRLPDCNAVILMDSDLQHPPQLLPQMLALWEAQVEVVEAYKQHRGNNTLSNLFANSFYALFYYLSRIDLKNHSDFKLLDRKVAEAYVAMPERARFFRGLIGWMGFSSAQIPFAVPPRQYGQSSWSVWQLAKLSINAITSFSTAPLHIMTVLGVAFIGLSSLIGGIALYDKFTGTAVSGFTTVILLLLLIGGFLMLGLGMLGLYVAHIYHEVKHRPHYFTDFRRSKLKSQPPPLPH